MDTDRPSHEGREDVPSELSFISAPREADPMPVVTRPSEGTRPEPTSVMCFFPQGGEKADSTSSKSLKSQVSNHTNSDTSTYRS